MRKLFICAAFLLCACVASAQDFDNIVFDNRTYIDGLATVQCYLEDYPYSLPVITLNSDERLVLSFDDLGSDSRYLKYTFIHCTHDWKRDGLSQLEYLDGFMEDEISEYSYSFNTIEHYTHYTLSFPNDMVRIIKSGNYILYVYDDSQDNPILTQRFMVMEPSPAKIFGEVKQASDVVNMFTWQEVDFLVNTGNYIVRNPSMYLHASIVQNGRWDNAITGLRYRSGKPGEYSFNYDNNENAMPGSSEFRFFDTKSLRYNGSNIVSVGYKNSTNYAFVVQDEARPYGSYISNPTLHGYYYIKNEDFAGQNTEDYVKTVFTLRTEFTVSGGDLYIFGALTDWQIKPEAKMVQNPHNGLWEGMLFLKQGFYNYQYVYVKNGTQYADATYIEGSHWETANEYSVLVYLQDEGAVYDKLIGYSTFKMQ